MKWEISLVLLSFLISLALTASVDLDQDNEDCTVQNVEKCKAIGLYCCASKGQECCDELDFFDQFPSLEDSKAEPRSIVRGLLKIIGIMIGVAIFVAVVCCLCCCCCCSKHKRGVIYKPGDQQELPQQQQPQAQHPAQMPGFQPPPPSGYPAQGQPGYPPAPGGYPPAPADYQAPYMENPPPYPGPPLENPSSLNTGLPSKEDSSYQRQPAFNPNL